MDTCLPTRFAGSRPSFGVPLPSATARRGRIEMARFRSGGHHFAYAPRTRRLVGANRAGGPRRRVRVGRRARQPAAAVGGGDERRGARPQGLHPRTGTYAARPDLVRRRLARSRGGRARRDRRGPPQRGRRRPVRLAAAGPTARPSRRAERRLPARRGATGGGGDRRRPLGLAPAPSGSRWSARDPVRGRWSQRQRGIPSSSRPWSACPPSGSSMDRTTLSRPLAGCPGRSCGSALATTT